MLLLSNPGFRPAQLRFGALSLPLAACLLALFPAVCSAQTQTAQINGIVSDATGAVVPDASVQATNIDTGVPRATTSNQTGNFVLSNLVPGHYRIDVSKQGFRSAVVPNLELDVNQTASVPIQLAIG